MLISGSLKRKPMVDVDCNFFSFSLVTRLYQDTCWCPTWIRCWAFVGVTLGVVDGVEVLVEVSVVDELDDRAVVELVLNDALEVGISGRLDDRATVGPGDGLDVGVVVVDVTAAEVITRLDVRFEDVDENFIDLEVGDVGPKLGETDKSTKTKPPTKLLYNTTRKSKSKILDLFSVVAGCT